MGENVIDNINTFFTIKKKYRVIFVQIQSLVIMHPSFPYEIVDMILFWVQPSTQQFRLSTILQRYFVQKRTLVSDVRFDMDHASGAGHVTLLDWWKHTGLECRYTKNAMNWASQHGHVAVLDWWKDSGLECRYTHWAMNGASINGHVAFLDWWKHSGLECRYSDWAMNWSSQNGHVTVLDWWKHSGLECRYSDFATNLTNDNPQ
jgi:hypothetical protein